MMEEKREKSQQRENEHYQLASLQLATVALSTTLRIKRLCSLL
jgi:hypothetical protein